MKTFIKKSLQGLLLVPMFALGVSAVAVPMVLPEAASAQDFTLEGGIQATGGDTTTGADPTTLITRITDILLFIVGAVAVIMIIWGGFKYITSGGDSSSVTSAKNTILYAVIGLIIAILAYAIINFVRGSITA